MVRLRRLFLSPKKIITSSIHPQKHWGKTKINWGKQKNIWGDRPTRWGDLIMTRGDTKMR
ncbi:hypothetical protein D1003_07160 [Riemerella anatipestifer]|nr:hypothetical protein [Riemerella anatipestifer]